MHHLLSFLGFFAAVLVAAKVVPGIRVKSVGGALVFALVFAILEKLLFYPLTLITLPLVIMSFGLFLIIINAFLFWLADKLVSKVEVDGFGAALFGSVVVSVLNWGIHFVLRLV
ncbi:MAG: phage holin family protein [Polyangia bacterium]